MRIVQDEDVLLVVDMQNDHVSGTLEHPGASGLIEPINRMAKAFDHVIIVKDWHPADHVSFAASHPELDGAPRGMVQTHYGDQIAAAGHCVQGTWGAEFDPGFELSKAELEFRKGYRRDTDSYSAFHMNDGTPTGPRRTAARPGIQARLRGWRGAIWLCRLDAERRHPRGVRGRNDRGWVQAGLGASCDQPRARRPAQLRSGCRSGDCRRENDFKAIFSWQKKSPEKCAELISAKARRMAWPDGVAPLPLRTEDSRSPRRKTNPSSRPSHPGM